jgi:hypothetical protein
MCLQQNDLEYLLPTGQTSLGCVFKILEGSSSTTSPPTKSHQTSPASAHPHSSPNATCWEILTLRLGSFAREHIEKHGASTLTDDMLQHQARLILYDDDDTWNQTAADNPEWLGLFKKAHGLEADASLSGDIAPHEVLEDLGLNPNAQLDKSFSLKHFRRFHKNNNHSHEQALAIECRLAGSLNISKIANGLDDASEAFNQLPGVNELTTATTAKPLARSPGVATGFHGLEPPMQRLASTLWGGDRGRDGNGAVMAGKGKTSFFPNMSTMHMPPVLETTTAATTTSNEAMPDHFGFPNWDQLPEGFDASMPISTTMPDFNIPGSAAAGFDTNTSLSADFDIGFGDGGLDMGTETIGLGSGFDAVVGNEGVIQGTIDNPQIMRWDDEELGFDMDMDLDRSLDLVMGDMKG